MFLRRSLAAIVAILLLVGSPAISAATETDEISIEAVDPSALAAPDKPFTGFVPKGTDKDADVDLFVHVAGKPVITAYAEAKAKGKGLTLSEQKALRAQMDVDQQRVAKTVKALGGTVRFTYKDALNAMAVRVKRSQLDRIAKLPGVTRITPVQVIELNNQSSVPFIGATDVHSMTVEGANVTGTGIRVAVIDTGIDYTHKNFRLPADPAADYATNDPDSIEPGTFPTAKVVGGYDFAGDDYDAGDPAKSTPNPDDDPLDLHGHGTHVAGTIAGFGVGSVGPGVAPGALLYAYKVFGTNGSTDLTAAAINRAMDPDQDGDLSDHVDVINMSLGAPFGSVYDGSAMAAEAAAAAGIIVVASAGNEGNIPYITGSPAVAAGAISVAASADDGIVHSAIQINSPAAIAGKYEAAEGAITVPLSSIGPVTGDLAYVGRGCSADPYLSDPAGKIALIDRGACNFSEKILKAQGAGAVAVVMANNVAGDPIVMGGSSAGITIAGVMVAKSTGDMIKAAGTVNVTLSNAIVVPRPDLADTLAGFTSRGPGRPDGSFKPDIAAPGLEIFSAAVGTGDGGAKMSGTSMAAPHMAGVAALMRQLHPDWSVAEIKAALMNTTTTTRDALGNEYPLSLQGTGRVQANKAALTSSFAMPAGIGLGFLPVTDITTETRTITVTNKSNADKHFALSAAFVGQAWGTTADLPASITVPANGEASFELALTFHAADLPNPKKDEYAIVEVSGRVLLTEAGGDSLVVGFTAIPEKASAASLSPGEITGGNAYDLLVSNTGAGPGIASLFYLGGTDDVDTNVVAPEGDLLYAGARENKGRLEFAVAMNGSASTQTANEVDIYIDVNHDGSTDYIVFSYDYGYVASETFSGKPAIFIYNVKTKKLSATYYLPVPYRYNSRVLVLPVDKSLLGISGEANIDWTVLSFPYDGGVDYIAGLTFQELPKGHKKSVDMLTIFPYNAPENQFQVITVSE